MTWLEEPTEEFLKQARAGTFRGAVKNLLNHEYHALTKYYSSTHLKYIFVNSPKHFKGKYLDGKDLPDVEPKKHMKLGSLVHSQLLSSEKFLKEFLLLPELNLRTKADREEKERLLSLHKGKDLVTKDEVNTSLLMAESIAKNTQTMPLLNEGIYEGAIFWECPFSGLKFKAKIDHHKNSEYMCEIKSANDVSEKAFSKQMDDLNYDLSLVHYSMGYKTVFDKDFDKIYFICVESEPPYVSQVYPVGKYVMLLGHEKWLEAVNKLSDCLKTNSWPGYFSEETEAPEIQPPAWKVNEYMKRNNNGIP